MSDPLDYVPDWFAMLGLQIGAAYVFHTFTSEAWGAWRAWRR